MAKMQSLVMGSCKVTYLPDGEARIAPTQLFPDSSTNHWKKYARYLNGDGLLELSRGAFLIDAGLHHVLIDLGCAPSGSDEPETESGFMASFSKLGISRDAITEVVFTHFHLDHVGWTSIEFDGKRQLTFPKAQYFCSKTEWEFWEHDTSEYAPDHASVLVPLKDKIQFVLDGEEIIPGLTVIDAAGHTPGMINLMLSAGDERVYFVADTIHSPVQFYEPDWVTSFDSDRVMAKQYRARACEKMLKSGTVVAAGHLAGHAFGRLLTDKSGKRLWEAIL